jgi:dTDP-4-amino-4,6-dideoxygalactose transaminase
LYSLRGRYLEGEDILRKQFLPFHQPDIGSEEIDAVVRTLRSGWLTTGPETRAFEKAFAEFVGARHAIAVNSGTAALHLALDAIGLKAGDEVLVPTWTFAATAEVVLYFNAKPVLVDCDPETLNIDPALLEASITPRTRAIIPVHVAGQPCDMDRILDIAHRRDLRVIEDAAHALPARWRGKLIGTLSDITCFSFYATKTITTGEGGMVTTDNDAYAERMRIMSLHGISRTAWNRYSADGSWYYEILYPGYKYNMTDIAAAIGREQLRKAEPFWCLRQAIAQTYDHAFADVPEIVVPRVRREVQHAWHLYIVQLALEGTALDRGRLFELLKQQNIGCSVHFIPLHVHPYYRDTFGYRLGDFPSASAAYERVLSLPLHTRMTDADAGDVIDTVRTIIAQHRR